MSKQYFTVIRWHVEDLKECFEKRGIPATQENINTFLNSRAPRTLSEGCIEAGYDLIDAIIDDMSDELRNL